VLAVPVLHAGLIHQAEIGLMDQARGAKGVLLALAEELPVGDTAQLPVDEWEQPVERSGVVRT
jgi:hypothetical protein